MRYDTSTFLRDTATILSAGDVTLYRGFVDAAGDYLYLARQNSGTSRVVKVDLNTFTRDSSVNFLSSDFGIYAAARDPNGTYGYFGTDGGRVVRVDLDTMTRVDHVAFAGGPWLDAAPTTPPDGDLILFGVYDDPGRVIGLNTSDFTEASTVVLSTDEAFVHSAAVDSSGTYTSLPTT